MARRLGGSGDDGCNTPWLMPGVRGERPIQPSATGKQRRRRLPRSDYFSRTNLVIRYLDRPCSSGPISLSTIRAVATSPRTTTCSLR